MKEKVEDDYFQLNEEYMILEKMYKNLIIENSNLRKNLIEYEERNLTQEEILKRTNRELNNECKEYFINFFVKI